MNKHNVERAAARLQLDAAMIEFEAYAIRQAFNPDSALINKATETVHDKLQAYLDAVVCTLQAELKEMGK